MKLVFYICSFALISFTVGDSIKLGSGSINYDTCLTENNVSNDDMFTLNDIIHDRHKQSENQERINKNGCVLQCLMQKDGMMEESEYNIEKFREISARINEITKSGLERNKAMENCINETKDLTEKCEKSFAFSECFLKAKENIFRKYVSERENESEK